MKAAWDLMQQALAMAPLPWLVLTMSCYLAAVWLYQRSGQQPWLIPVFTAVPVVVSVLWLTDTPYATYQQGTAWISLLIGPATVALALPLYAQRERIRRLWRPIVVALLVGCVVALLSAMGIAWLLGATLETTVSLAPKSATIPIALPLAERGGGLASLAAVAVAITGIAGTIAAPWILRRLHCTDPAVQGFALGLTAHAIGTARSIQQHPTAGAFAALAMGLNGVATAVLMPWLLGLVLHTGR